MEKTGGSHLPLGPWFGGQEDSECSHGSTGLPAPLLAASPSSQLLLVFPQSRRPFILPTPGSQSTASGLLGPRIHPLAPHGLWASSPMMCNRWAGGQAALGLGSRGPCFFACQFLARGGNECSRNLGVGWWRQPPGIHFTMHFTPHKHFRAWAGRPALEGKTHNSGDSNKGSTGSHIRQGKTKTS